MSLTKYEFLILAALLRQPMHPYAIRQEIIGLTQHRIWPSRFTIRSSLERLSRRGLVLAGTMESEYWLRARRGMPYELTEKGLWAVRRELATYHGLFVKSWQRLGDFDDKL